MKVFASGGIFEPSEWHDKLEKYINEHWQGENP